MIRSNGAHDSTTEHYAADGDGRGSKRKVASGEYTTESEVIREGLRALMARDRAVDQWLRKQVVPAYEALKANPSRAVGVRQVRARLAEEHKRTSTKK